MNKLANAKFDGAGHVELIGEDGHSVTLQLRMLDDIQSKAKTFGSGKLNPVQGAGEWNQITGFLVPYSLDVGVLATKEGQRLALTVDRGRPTEHTLSFDRSIALALSEELAATVARIDGSKPRTQ